MFIFNGKKVAFDAVVYIDGVAYSVGNPSDRKAAGIKEVDDPVWPEPAYAYNVTENIDGTLNIEKKPQEVIDEIETEHRRQKREELFSKADVLFFKEQRGEIAAGTWIAECQRIRQEYPQ